MIKHGYYIVDRTTDELWEVRYMNEGYTTLDIPDVTKSDMTYEEVLSSGFKIKTFDEVISLLPYPQLP